MSVVSDFTCSIWLSSHRRFMNSLFHCMGRAGKFFPSIGQKVAELLKHNDWDEKLQEATVEASLRVAERIEFKTIEKCGQQYRYSFHNAMTSWICYLEMHLFNSTVTWMHHELFFHTRHQNGKLSLNTIISILTLIRKKVSFVKTSRKFMETNITCWKVTFIWSFKTQ